MDKEIKAELNAARQLLIIQYAKDCTANCELHGLLGECLGCISAYDAVKKAIAEEMTRMATQVVIDPMMGSKTREFPPRPGHASLCECEGCQLWKNGKFHEARRPQPDFSPIATTPTSGFAPRPPQPVGASFDGMGGCTSPPSPTVTTSDRTNLYRRPEPRPDCVTPLPARVPVFEPLEAYPCGQGREAKEGEPQPPLPPCPYCNGDIRSTQCTEVE